MSDDAHAHAAVFTNDDTRLAPGWSDEEVAAVFARTTVDLTRAPPAKDARLRLTAVFGEIDLVVPPGLALDVEGTSVFGASQAPPRTGEPTLHVTTTAVFGAIRVRESPS